MRVGVQEKEYDGHFSDTTFVEVEDSAPIAELLKGETVLFIDICYTNGRIERHTNVH